MVDTHTPGCLEPEVLAAYVDQGLSLAERARVEGHLASCPQCTALLAGVVRTVAEIAAVLPHAVEPVEATPRVSWRTAAGALTAAAAVIAVLAGPALLRPWLERDAGLVGLAGSVGEQRSVLGRLTGGFPHAPLDVSSAGGQDDAAAGTGRVLLTAGRIRESVGELATPSRLHALGVSQLLARRYDDAAQLLLAASREQPANAQYLSDVAAVQLERARRGLRPDDLPRALAAANRARRLDPSLREAWFNRALAISALSLTDQAKAAWTEYLRRDSTSPWAAEARKHLEELSRPTPAAAWTQLEGRLQQSIDAQSADAAVRAQTTEARNFIESLFARWASLASEGAETGGVLEDLRTMAAAYTRVAGDTMFIDAVAAIDKAATRGPGPVRELADSHVTFARAAALFAEDRFSDSEPHFEAARGRFIEAGSPFAMTATIARGAIAYVGARAKESEALLEATLRDATTRNYKYAEARSAWLLGLMAMQQGRIGDAQTLYERTLATFQAMGDAEQVGNAHALLAGLHFYLSNTSAEWEHRIASLEALTVSRSFRFRHAILASASDALLRSDPESALTAQEAVIANARAWGREGAVAEALGQRAAGLTELGRHSEATVALAEARGHLSRVTDPEFRSRLEVALLATESELVRPADPAAAVAAAGRAIGLIVTRRDRMRLAQLQLKLAKANIAWGRLPAAEIALNLGIQIFDEERRTVSGEGRISDRDEAWGLFEAGVQLAIRNNDLERAFALAERARVRSLTEARRVSVDRSLASVRSALGAGDAIVALNQFEDELAVWVIRRDAAHVFTRPLSRRDARRLVARQQHEIAFESRPAASRDLYNEVLKPASASLTDVTRLIVVPDPTFEGAAFAALWDASRGKFLVEEKTVLLSPSANAFVSIAARQPGGEGDAVLVLGAQSEAAQVDAQGIAAAVPASRLLIGDLATRDRLLSDTSTHQVIHLAAPMRVNASHPLLSQVGMTDAPGARHSGTVFGSEIAAATFDRTRLVVVDEVTSEITNRGEGTLYFARAFMAAGVPAVLATLPGANEAATRDLMIAFHREMSKGISAEEALSTLQRNALQQNGRRLGAWTALVMYGSDR